MKIRLLRNTVCDGRVASVGDVVEASERAAQILIAMRKAEVYVAPPVEHTTAFETAEHHASEAAVGKRQRRAIGQA